MNKRVVPYLCSLALFFGLALVLGAEQPVSAQEPSSPA
jgi:hypothetical protein